MFRLPMWPANAACNAVDMTDEIERGMVRMLVDTTLWLTAGITVLTAVWLP